MTVLLAGHAAAHLDAALAAAGTPVVLRRTEGSGPAAIHHDAEVPAVVRARGRPDELTSGITQDDIAVVLSMSDLAAAGWPDGGGGSLPRKGDRLISGGRHYRIEQAVAFRIGDRVVRIELLARGAAG